MTFEYIQTVLHSLVENLTICQWRHWPGSGASL